jgi:DNA-binding transcriptional regulator YdaS (Cro superfamily)
MRVNRERDAGIIAAIAAVGSLTEISRRLGISVQSISEWKRVPSVRVLQIEQATGVSRHRLRPDLYPINDARHALTPAELTGLQEFDEPKLTRKHSRKAAAYSSAQPALTLPLPAAE